MMCASVGLLGLTVWASEKPSAEFVNAMKISAAAQAAATKAMKEEDFDTVEKEAAKIVEAFPAIEKYWSVRAPDVVPMARVASKAASDLRVSAQQRSVEGLEYSSKDLVAACKNCHDAHREKMPDGTFEIK
ncbi:MAG: hypothetical protein U0P30_09545 [Vicinamibacterales bacterium]